MACAVRPGESDGRDADVEVHREGGCDVDEWQSEMFGHRPTRLLDLIDNEVIDAFIADRVRRVPQDHLRFHHHSANSAAQRGESFELATFLVALAERTEREVVLTNLAEPQPSGPDGRLQVGNLEVDHVVASGLQSPAQRGERIVMAWRGETQDAYSTIHDVYLLDCSGESDEHDRSRLRREVRPGLEPIIAVFPPGLFARLAVSWAILEGVRPLLGATP